MVNRMFEKLVAAFQLMCLPLEQQKSYYPDFVYVPEGILSTIYDEGMAYVAQLKDAGLLSDEITHDITAFENHLNQFVDEFGIDFELKHINNPKWLALKEESRNILIKLNQNIEPPDCKWI